jgi:transposase
VTPLVPKPLTSGAKADGRFGKQDFVYDPGQDVYRCSGGETLTWRYLGVEEGLKLHNYWTTICAGCALKSKCTPAISSLHADFQRPVFAHPLSQRGDLVLQPRRVEGQEPGFR